MDLCRTWCSISPVLVKMSIFEKIYKQAKTSPKRIVLPEGDEPRVIEAASRAIKENLAQVVLLGQSEVIAKKARQNNLDISRIEIIDPQTNEKLGDYADIYWNLRKHRGVTLQVARDLLSQNFVYYAAVMLRQGEVDGFVAGACYTTSDVARAALHCIERDTEHSTVSGSFLVEVEDRQFGENGLFLFADCAIVPDPSARQLANIAAISAQTWVKVTGYKPRLAMLSFSTHGSSSHTSVDKVREATEMVRSEMPDLIVDGELQLDSAIVPAVARIKVPQSLLAGKANILIFPNLDAGNIAYKLIQRLAEARVAGPVIQGLAKPCSDLSRGCGPQEIIDAIAVTVVRAQ